MLPINDFIKSSLELHLFYARIMKEHAFFILVGLLEKDANFIKQADYFYKAFESLLANVVELSIGVVNADVLQSGELFTNYTIQAEMITSNLTGIPINLDITKAEQNLIGQNQRIDQKMEDTVMSINYNAIILIKTLIQFKTALLSSVSSCRSFIQLYPHFIDHMIKEALLYTNNLERLQKREDISIISAFEQKALLNEFMGDHAKFIRGLLDTTETDLFIIANDISGQFDQLTTQAMTGIASIKTESIKSLLTTKLLRDYNTLLTVGLLDCKIESMILPLFSDHLLREANYYIRILESFELLEL